MTVQGRTMNADGTAVTHTINYPLTCRFQIIKSSVLSAGSATFRIYNLASDVRSDIYKDAFEQIIYKQITFSAGYSGEQLPLVFQGNVKQAFSYRQGPDWITEISCLDGGYARDNSTANVTKPYPYKKSDLARAVVSQMAHVTLGALGDLDSASPAVSRGVTASGNAWDYLTRTVLPTGGFAFINNEKVYIVNQWEYLLNQGLLTEINYDTGIIGTPRLQANHVNVQMLFEPRLEPQQQVHLTTLESRMSGDYTVLRLIHAGTISGAVCETFTTEATLFQPDRPFVEVAA